MNTCNDPKCPLNRQGVSHEPHHIIESRTVTDPCNDPRCAMNRMGMPHNSHSGQYGQESEEPPETQAGKMPEKPEWFTDDSFDGTASDALEELARQIHGSAAQDRAPAGRTEPPPRQTRDKPNTGLTSKEGILGARNPRKILGVEPGASYDEIKAKYKEMVREYDASKGMLNKSQAEKDESNRVMAKINHAYSQLRRMHRGET